jgi:hypothetical protein
MNKTKACVIASTSIAIIAWMVAVYTLMATTLSMSVKTTTLKSVLEGSNIVNSALTVSGLSLMISVALVLAYELKNKK